MCSTLEELSFNIKMVIFGEPILTGGGKGLFMWQKRVSEQQ